MKHLLGIENLNRDQIMSILETAKALAGINSRPIKKVPTLKGKSVVTFFAEPSTKTKLAFEVAAKRLSADRYDLSVSSGSITEGETLSDTALNIQAMQTDALIVRHPVAGTAHHLASIMDCSIINAGDGFHEHPTQALQDALTIWLNKGRFEGLKVVLMGDIANSGVARSNIYLLKKMGVHVTLFGPATMIPPGIEKVGVEVADNAVHAVEDADVIMMMRIQKESEGNLFYPDKRDFSKYFSLNSELLKRAKADVVVMHPGHVTRGVEIEDAIMDGERSLILEQVSNGVAVKMAVLYLLLGGSH